MIGGEFVHMDLGAVCCGLCQQVLEATCTDIYKPKNDFISENRVLPKPTDFQTIEFKLSYV